MLAFHKQRDAEGTLLVTKVRLQLHRVKWPINIMQERPCMVHTSAALVVYSHFVAA